MSTYKTRRVDSEARLGDKQRKGFRIKGLQAIVQVKVQENVRTWWGKEEV